MAGIMHEEFNFKTGGKVHKYLFEILNKSTLIVLTPLWLFINILGNNLLTGMFVELTNCQQILMESK